MKKHVLVLCAALFVAASANAQNLGSLLGSVLGSTSSTTSSSTSTTGSKASSLLNTLGNVIYAYTGNTTAVSLPGTWNYNGSAVALSGESTLSNIVSTAGAGTIENKVDSYLSKVGITAGALTFTFNEDLTFSCTVKGIPVNGTWKTLNDGASVQLQFGKTMKFMSMTGDLKSTTTGCEMLFEGKKFLSFAKTILSYVGKQSGTASTISSLADNYDNMKIGFKLTKSK